MSDKEISLPVNRVLDMCRVAEWDERTKIVQFMKLHSSHAFDRINDLAEKIKDGEHLK